MFSNDEHPAASAGVKILDTLTPLEPPHLTYPTQHPDKKCIVHCTVLYVPIGTNHSDSTHSYYPTSPSTPGRYPHPSLPVTVGLCKPPRLTPSRGHDGSHKRAYTCPTVTMGLRGRRATRQCL